MGKSKPQLGPAGPSRRLRTAPHLVQAGAPSAHSWTVLFGPQVPLVRRHQTISRSPLSHRPLSTSTSCSRANGGGVGQWTAPTLACRALWGGPGLCLREVLSSRRPPARPRAPGTRPAAGAGCPPLTCVGALQEPGAPAGQCHRHLRGTRGQCVRRGLVLSRPLAVRLPELRREARHQPRAPGAEVPHPAVSAGPPRDCSRGVWGPGFPGRAPSDAGAHEQ